MAAIAEHVDRKRGYSDIGPLPASKRLRISRAQPYPASFPLPMQMPYHTPPQVRRRDRRPARGPQVAGYWRSGNTYDVAITIGGRKVFFARAVPTEAQAERLAREVQRISKQHAKDVASIREELRPIADELGVNLTAPPAPLRNYKTRGDGSYEVSKVIDGRRVYFATRLASEATAMRLASEVQHFFQIHGSNVTAIRRSLQPIVEELGIELPQSQSYASFIKKPSIETHRMPMADARPKTFRSRDEQSNRMARRRLTTCGRYNVKKRVQGKIVYFATRVYSKAKAMRLATEVQRLVGIHGDDVDAIRNQLQPVAEELGVKLTVPQGKPLPNSHGVDVKRKLAGRSLFAKRISSKIRAANFYRAEDSTYSVGKHFGCTHITFATGVHSESSARQLASELQRLAKIHVGDVQAIRKELKPVAEELGLQVTAPMRDPKNRSAGMYNVRKKVGGKVVYFATCIPSKEKAEQLASEVQRLSRVHGENLNSIRRELQPFAEQLGVELSMPEVLGFHKKADGTFSVARQFGKRQVTFASDIHSEQQAKKLASELQRLVTTHRFDIPGIRRDLKPIAKDLGVQITVPQRICRIQRSKPKDETQSREVAVESPWSTASSKILNYFIQKDGKFEVRRKFEGVNVVFARGVSSESKASRLGVELHRLATVHQNDVASIRRDLQKVGNELEVALTGPHRQDGLPYYKDPDGSFRVSRLIMGTRTTFASSIGCEIKAAQFGREVQRTAQHSTDLVVIRKELQSAAVELGLKVFYPTSENPNCCSEEDGWYYVQKKVGDLQVSFANGISSKNIAERLATEVQRLVDLHGDNIPLIFEDLQPSATELGVRLTIPETLEINAEPALSAEGKFEVKKKLGGKAIYFAKRITSKANAEMLASEVQRLMSIHGTNISAVRKDLRPMAAKLGVELTVPRLVKIRGSATKLHHRTMRGTATVSRLLNGQTVTFAEGLCVEEREKLASEVEHLVDLHGEDAETIWKELVPVAENLGVKLATPLEDGQQEENAFDVRKETAGMESVKAATYYQSGEGSYDVQKRIGAKTVFFARRLSSESKAERLTAEVQRLSRLHCDDVEAIRTELRPFADYMELELAVPRCEEINYRRSSEGTFQLVKHNNGKSVILANGIQTETQVKQLVREAQHLAPASREDFGRLCRELQPLALELGVKIAMPQEKHPIGIDEGCGAVGETQPFGAQVEGLGAVSEPNTEVLNYSVEDDGTYCVFKTLGGRRVDFAVNVPTVAKAEQLAQEIEFLVQLHGADVASICEELKLVADELNVKLLGYEDHAA